MINNIISSFTFYPLSVIHYCFQTVERVSQETANSAFILPHKIYLTSNPNNTRGSKTSFSDFTDSSNKAKKNDGQILLLS